MLRSLHIEPSKCTSCLQCEMACSLENEGVINPARSRIRVFQFHADGKFVPYTCTQCAEAWCMQACPVDAISNNLSTGAKEVNVARCVGCKVCTIACPFGTINYQAHSGKVIKCDLCGGDPACVKACPTGAITYIDADTTGLDRMRAWAAKTGAQPAAAQA
ncbi:MAG: 4Fe-4S dicluster domain-containing protein [Proteobacteria bacterium]|nr:MAG: 4Fe-4S dicluster domain-containing protein [Pseudomonadota bacterium]QKK12435.1 MAG: 4Fe-4S dicluster domain-containing protein [Pseudomonadota bacterium]